MKAAFKARWLLALLALLVLSCAQLGVPQADTFNKKVTAAAATAEGLVSTANNLALAGKISKQDHGFVLKRAKELKLGLETASKMHATNPLQAEDNLQLAINALTILQGTLASIEPEVKR